MNAQNDLEEEVTLEDVERVLDVGRILFSALTPKERERFQEIMTDESLDDEQKTLLFHQLFDQGSEDSEGVREQ